MYSSNYWHQFGYQNNQSNLDILFQKEDSTIEDFLNEDNIITEIKLSVQKFSDHLIKNPDKLEKLINYIIIEPDTNEAIDQNRWYKYPYLSSEIFAIQLPELADFLFEKIDQDLQRAKNDSIEPQSEDTHEIQENIIIEPDEINNKPQIENQNSPDKTIKSVENNSNDQVSQQMEIDHPDVDSNQMHENYNDQETEEIQLKQQQVSNKNERGNYYLKKLLAFTINDNILNATSAGYFQKTMGMLVTKYGYFWNFLIENPEYLQYLTLHSYNVSICNIIIKLLIVDGVEKNEFDDSDQKREPEDKFFKNRVRFLEKLFQQFKDSQNSEQIENLSQIFIEIIQTVKSNQNSQNQSLLQLDSEIYRKDNLQILMARLSNEEQQDIFFSASVLNEIIISFTSNKPYESNNDDEEVNYETKDEKFNYPIDFFIKNYDFLLNVLKKNKRDSIIEVSYGGEQIAFGFGKIKILELIGNLLKTKSQDLYIRIHESDFYSFLFDISISFEWNNMLHIQIDKILNISLDSDNELLLESIFIKSNYINQIIEALKYSEIKPGSCKKSVKRGYFGFLTNLSKTITKYEENTQYKVTKYLKDNPDWQSFVDNHLKFILENESQLLGGQDPRKKQIEEQEDTMIDLDIQKIYEKFRPLFQNNQNETTEDEHTNPDLETIDVNTSPTRKIQDYEEGSPEVYSPEQQIEEINYASQDPPSLCPELYSPEQQNQEINLSSQNPHTIQEDQTLEIQDFIESPEVYSQEQQNDEINFSSQNPTPIQEDQKEYQEEQYQSYTSSVHWRLDNMYDLEDIVQDIC